MPAPYGQESGQPYPTLLILMGFTLSLPGPDGRRHAIPMKKLDTAALEIFVAAVEEQSLSKAGERENLVTSAISKRISDLEKHLGKRLLQRHGRGVEPTAVGDMLYQRAKLILRNLHQTEEAVAAYASDGTPRIRLLANPSTNLQFLPGPIATFLAGRRNTSIDLLESHSYDIPRLIASGHGDIGIYHAEQPATGVISYQYKKDRVGLVVPNGHPLSRHDQIHFEDALDYDLLGYFPRHSLDQFLSYIGPGLSRPPNVKLQVANFETRCNMVREGLGIAVVPERIAANYLGPMGLTLIHLLDDWAERQFYICISPTDGSNGHAAELLEHLLRELRE